ncbi:hypothetical protein PC121_g4 [Phytophthora cactorum]|nr:hypothetical protein PC121_g4 [Phytophthora cactorum]
MRCFRCKKPGHRAAVCRAPAPVVANVTIESDVAVAGQAKNGDNHSPVLRAQLFAITSGSDSRLIVLSLHADGAARPVRALLDSGATNNFVLAESLLLLPADMRGSDDFLVIELSGSFGCDFGIPWLARNQPHIDWLTRTVRPRDIDVNAVLAFLSGTPNYWPHVAVTDPDSMTTAVSGESDGPSCAACERATCAGPEPEPQDILDVVEHGFPRPDEQWLSRLSVASHTRISMGSRMWSSGSSLVQQRWSSVASRMWSSGSSLKWSMRSSRVSRIQTPTPPVGVVSLQT